MSIFVDASKTVCTRVVLTTACTVLYEILECCFGFSFSHDSYNFVNVEVPETTSNEIINGLLPSFGRWHVSLAPSDSLEAYRDGVRRPLKHKNASSTVAQAAPLARLSGVIVLRESGGRSFINMIRRALYAAFACAVSSSAINTAGTVYCILE